MNNEMDDSETLSVSAWEKTAKGKVAMAACDKKSGWDKKSSDTQEAAAGAASWLHCGRRRDHAQI
jgi:hypothetical protein